MVVEVDFFYLSYCPRDDDETLNREDDDHHGGKFFQNCGFETCRKAPGDMRRCFPQVSWKRPRAIGHRP